MNLVPESNESNSFRRPMSDIIKIQSISQVHDFFGFEKPKHPLVSVLELTDEITNADYGDASYFIELYQVSLKSGITGSISYGRNSYDFQEGSMVFTKPGQVLKIDNDEDLSNSSGWTLIFHPDLIRNSHLGKHIEDYSFFDYDVHEALHLSEEEKGALGEIVRKIEREYNQNIDKHSQKLIVSNIELLLDYCSRYFDRQFYTRTNLNKDLLSKFEQLLREYFSSEKPQELGLPMVAYCGTELGMSANYLSDMLKKETGSSAQEHIHAYLVDKAKTELLGTTEPISQIAYQLGFEYPPHFTKVFKKVTGMSPAEYRQLN